MNDCHIGKAANAGNVKINEQTNHIYGTNPEKDSCLKDLYITNPEADKKRIEREKGGLLKDCYNWILYNDNFLQWRDDPEQHLLWIRGDPGKGKTMLLAGLITELEKTSDDGILYFFCQAARPSHRTASNVLRGVIWLFVSKRPDLRSYVRREYDQGGSNIFADHNAWYALSGILTAILEDETSADCIIIIDALDECTEDREKLINYISQCSISCKSKWIISSRNWSEIEFQLDATQRQVQLHLELNHAAISNAVATFVNRKVTQLNSTFNEPTRAQIRKHLLDNANDTFLWVALVCQELERPGVKHYHSSSILQRFPTGLNELYERMISDINDRDMRWCRAILAVIAVALRPLSLQELAAADGDLTEWVEDKETLSSLVTSCGSLLTIRGDTVYTVHQSVNEFLRSTPRILHSGIAQQQLSIFLSSIKVMQSMLHRNLYKLKDNCALINDIPALPSAPLTIAGYACIHWVDHFCEWPLTDDQNQSHLCYALTTQFLESKYLYWLEAMSLLHCASEAIKAMQRLEDKLEHRVSDDLRLLVQDAVRFASTHRAIIEAAPLQLYDSALIFTPQFGKIKGCFNQEISKSIDRFSPGFQQWNACLQTIPGIAIDWLGQSSCEISPDGQQIAAINSNNDSILLIDASTGVTAKSIGSPGGLLYGFIFHPGGDLLVISSGNDEKKLTIFHLPSGECSKSFKVDRGYQSAFLSFSLDGQLLALASEHYAVDIWDTASESRIGSFPIDFVDYIFWIHIFSHPNALLVLGEDDISIWGLDTRYQASKLMSLTGIEAPEAAAVNHDRTRCAVLHDSGLVLYSWDSSIATHKIAQLYTRGLSDVSWIADDRLLALCGDFGIKVWDIEAKRLVAQVMDDSTQTICYGINRQLASFGNRGDVLKIWSLDTILSNSEPIDQQSATAFKAFITSPSGKVAVISDNAQSDMLSIAVNARFHQLPKTLPNSSPGSYYKIQSLVLGHDDYFAVPTNGGAIDLFNLQDDTGLYYCERRIEEHVVSEDVPSINLTIEFWGHEQIIACSDCFRFWDLKTGKSLRMAPIPPQLSSLRSNIIADGRIAFITRSLDVEEVVVWDIMCRKETQYLDLDVLQPNNVFNISLASSGILAISAWGGNKYFIAIGNANDGSWIRKYSLPNDVPTLNFLTPKLRLDTGFGALAYDIKHGSPKDINMQTVAAEDHWDPRYLRLSYSESDAWLMRGSRRILWIPRQDVDLRRFSIQTDLEAGKSTVTLVHNGCLFKLTIDIDSV